MFVCITAGNNELCINMYIRIRQLLPISTQEAVDTLCRTVT